MLANSITVNDGTDDHIYDLVSRESMNSRRVSTTDPSSLANQLVIKNTVDYNSSAKNRHLVQLSKNEIDATTGIKSTGSVYFVISRDKDFTDAEILLMAKRLSGILATAATITDILKGGN